jgi:hypothetical protein
MLDSQNKLYNNDKICSTLRTLKTKTRKETQKKLYKIVALPTLLYGSESETVKARDIYRIQSVGVR